MTRPPTVLIIDVATTGYHERSDHILEIACILLDARTLEVKDTVNCLVRHTKDEVQGAPDFHEALVKECLREEGENLASLKATEGFLLAGAWTMASAVCNRALDFDLKFIKHHMPTLHRALPRLQIELKSVELLLTARGVPEFKPSFPRTYRAADDAITAYDELLHWLSSSATEINEK